MNKFVWLICAVLTLCRCSQTAPHTTMQTYSIEGVVTDRSGLPMPGVMVAIVEGTASYPDLAAMTNQQGQFSFGSLQKGEYTVKVFRESLSREEKVRITNENAKITIRLE